LKLSIRRSSVRERTIRARRDDRFERRT
jgi:hypothetical protein